MFTVCPRLVFSFQKLGNFSFRCSSGFLLFSLASEDPNKGLHSNRDHQKSSPSKKKWIPLLGDRGNALELVNPHPYYHLCKAMVFSSVLLLRLPGNVSKY